MRGSFSVALLLAVLSALMAIPLWRSENPSAATLELARTAGAVGLVALLAGGFWWRSLVVGRQNPLRGFIAGTLTGVSAHLFHFYPGIVYTWITGEHSPFEADPITDMPVALAGMAYGFAGLGTLGGGLAVLGLAFAGMLLSLKKRKPPPR